MKIQTKEIAGFYSAIEAVRLPHRNGDKSDSAFFPDMNEWEMIGSKDLQLLQNLITSGDDEAKVIRGIIVWADITAPRYLWQELDTYTVGVTPLCSESTMHVEFKQLTGEELQQRKGDLKESHEQRRIRAFSYQTLRRIYFQRRNHRLPEWKIFIEWIKTLPLANELILIPSKADILKKALEIMFIEDYRTYWGGNPSKEILERSVNEYYQKAKDQLFGEPTDGEMDS
jgi:hypothetical protein